MIEKTLAKRYASALLVVADKAGVVENVEAQLLALKDVYSRDADMRMVFMHPSISKQQKKDIIGKLFGSKFEQVLVIFLELLVDKNRLRFLPHIADAFDRLADVSKGVVRVDVKTFAPMSENQRGTLYEKLNKMIGKKIAVDIKQDRSLKGGMVIRIGDGILDGSVVSRLKRLREHLLGMTA